MAHARRKLDHFDDLTADRIGSNRIEGAALPVAVGTGAVVGAGAGAGGPTLS